MDLHESLTVRTVTALQRLADLEERGKTLAGPRATVLKTALRELEGALEELRVASEHLNEMVDQMAESRLEGKKAAAQFTEFRDVMPLGCVESGPTGEIVDANKAAGDLLNVAPRHLVGKPLSLYMVDRDRFFGMLNLLKLTREPVRQDLVVRPRERKPRLVSVRLVQLEDGNGLYWFLHESGE
jgi:PAS domain-containing protein